MGFEITRNSANYTDLISMGKARNNSYLAMERSVYQQTLGRAPSSESPEEGV